MNKTQNKNKNKIPSNYKAGEEEEEGLEKSNTGVSRPGPLSSKIRMIECKKVQVSLKKETGLPGPSKSTSRDDSLAEDDAEENIECLEGREGPLPKKRKRGRPVTTGDYERLKARRAEEQERREEEEEREILDPSTPMTNSQAWSRLDSKVAEYLEDMREASLVDITAQTLDCAMVLKKIAVRFKNMKGTVKKEIADAACLMQAALHTLAIRAPVSDTATAPEDRETEVEALRREIRELREDNIRLQGEIRTHIEMGKKKAPRMLPPEGASAKREKKEEEETMHPPTEEVGMEVDPSQGDPPAPEPIMRPPIKGVQKRLQIDYPVGVESEVSRKAYDAITEGIEKLLRKRSRLTNSCQPSPALNHPAKDSQSAAALANAKVVVPARSERGRKDVPRGKAAPKGAPNLGKKKEKGKTGPNNTAKDRKMASSEPTPLPPQTPSNSQETSWAKVVGRKERKKGGPATTPQATNPPPVKSSGSKKTSPPLAQREKGSAQRSAGPGAKAKARKAPRTAAVTITCPEGQYAETISLARQKINLSELGIEGVRARKAATGALVYEIPGEGKKEKADLFARKLQEVLQDREGVRVARPSKKGELRVRGLDESATKEEVVAAIARIGGCEVSEVKAGELRTLPRTMGTLWVQCPLQTANKVAAAGKITVGWVTAKVEALRARPLQCHRCLERGHVREKCTSAVDRSGACYNCGVPGHRANGCTAKTRCPLCAEAGLPAAHRVGSDKCHPKRRGGGETNTEKPPVNLPQKAARRVKRKGGPSPQLESAEPERTEGEPPKPQRGKGTPQEKEKRSTDEVPVADLIQLEEVVMEEA